MTTLLGISLGVSSLLFSQINILKGIGHSVFAFYATEAGLERALYLDNTECLQVVEHAPCLTTQFGVIGAAPPGSVTLSNGASYQIIAEAEGVGACPSGLGHSYCVKATGSFEQSRRAVRVAR